MSVEVDTVRGSIPTADMGITLMHEHVFVLSPEIIDNYPEAWGDEHVQTLLWPKSDVCTLLDHFSWILHSKIEIFQNF